MGSKNIKVIVLDATGMPVRAPKDLAKFQDANKRFVDGLKKHPVTGQGLPAYGTNILTNILNEVGGYPTYNFKQGRFDGNGRWVAGHIRRADPEMCRWIFSGRSWSTWRSS